MPQIELPKAFQPVISSKKRFVVLIGGRGSAKSESVARFLIMKAQTEGADVLCGREFQTSIDDSVHKLLKGLIQDKLQLTGFNVLDQKIDCHTGGGFRFKGFSRNSSAVKSAQGFKYSWIEESQQLSKDSIQDLTPTIRAKDSQLYFTANPKSSGDPFSKRFINPYLKELDKHGFYEDELHLIIKINYDKNPWFMDGPLDAERLWDFKHLPRAEYNHIWLAAFNDTVERAVIKPEWFDAAIDAHIKLGIKPTGAVVASFDVADEGEDSKGYACRKGILYTEVTEIDTRYGNDACEIALEKAIAANADLFVYDGDGMGALLRKQVNEALKGIKCDSRMYKGSLKADNPELFYDGLAGTGPKDKPKKNKDMFANKRAQFTIALADKFQRTYLAVEKKEYQDPDTLISLSSEIEYLDKLRSELCRIPLKDHGAGKIQIMPKPEMKRLYNIDSPGMADCVTMGGEVPEVIIKRQTLNFVEGFG